MRVALVAFLIVLGATAVHATPAQDLDRARQSFRARDWQSAIPLLKSVLYPSVSVGKDDAVEAHILLGASQFETGERETARDEFKKALEIDPDRSITTLTFSEGAVRVFDQTKEDLRARMEHDAEKKRLAEDRDRLRKYRESLVIYEAKPFYLTFFPFGLAQFNQGRTTRGVLFSVGQGLTFGTSFGVYLYLVGTYGFEAKVPLLSGPRVRLLQQIEVGTGIAFIGLYAWGVFEAIRNYKPRIQLQGDDSLLPPELREIDKKPKKTSLIERLHISPMITPSGVGIGIGLEN